MGVERAVILARGLGSHMRREDPGAVLDETQARVAETGVKALILIKRPFLDYILGVLADAGIRRVCLVIRPEHDELRRYYEEQVEAEQLTIEFAIQEQPLGTANAVSKSARGEYEITDAVQWCIDRGSSFTACLVDAPVLDLSSRNDIGPVKARLEHVEVRL